MSNEPKFYTRHEAASILRMSLRTVDNLLASGRLRSVKLGHRRLISKDVLLNLGDAGVRERLGV